MSDSESEYEEVEVSEEESVQSEYEEEEQSIHEESEVEMEEEEVEVEEEEESEVEEEPVQTQQSTEDAPTVRKPKAYTGQPSNYTGQEKPQAMGGEAVNFDALQRNRMEKDLNELQTLIASHFEQRKKDDEELDNLKERIEQRKEQRKEQMRIRQEREKQRLAREREERANREAEEERKKKEEEERKKKAIANMSAHYGGYLGRNDRNKNNRRQTEREKKRKLLSERRKPLNIDHLNNNKLQDKAKELFNWFSTLEEEKFDFEVRLERQKYDIGQLRQRVQEYMCKSGKGGKSAQKRQVKTLANVGARANVFK